MRTMEIGLVAHSAALCVSCLTICMLEIPSIVARYVESRVIFVNYECNILNPTMRTSAGKIIFFLGAQPGDKNFLQTNGLFLCYICMCINI
jgi:hypothetical protein